MRVIYARNVNEALMLGVNLLHDCGIPYGSRAGDVIEAPMPVTTHYVRPWERVLFKPERNANPFFHLFEALHMLAGRRDVAWLAQFNKRMAEYADADGNLNGSAYGYRWRTFFKYDQLAHVIDLLRADPLTRRAVLQMWHPSDLRDQGSKDLPCNTSVMFSLRGGYLRMTVTNRSNDMIWGTYGANVVHFSMLQEYVAGMLGAELGSYHQVSNNFHVYVDNPFWQKAVPWRHPLCPYDMGEVVPQSMFDQGVATATWGWDLNNFFKDPYTNKYHHTFFSRVVRPMRALWESRKEGLSERNLELLAQFPEKNDWGRAAREYVERNYGK